MGHGDMEMINVYGINYMGDPGKDGSITLKQILMQLNIKFGNGFHWLRMESSGRTLQIQ